LGAYVLDQTSQARFIVFDADNDPQMERLVKMAKSLRQQGVPSYLESSRRGGHLWIFLTKPYPGKVIRLFGKHLVEVYNLLGVEIFPKQNRLESGPGSLVRLPFGIHRKTGTRYGFITPDFQPLFGSFSTQLRIICAPKTVPEAFIEASVMQMPSSQKLTVKTGVDDSKKPLSERIKESVSVYDFISQYVELSPTGRGLCPLHDDRHSSFSVNIEENYWSCFSGCGGGSIIDFWMKFQKCDFKTAIHDLAAMLL
jgi:hypothetical protein